MTTTTNTTQKKLIKALIITHDRPRAAFIKAQEGANIQEREQLQRIAAAFKININLKRN